MCASIWTTKDVQVLQQALQKHRGDWPNLLKMLPGFTQKQIQNKVIVASVCGWNITPPVCLV